MKSDKPAKRSHTVACSSHFRDAVLALAASQRVNAADLARSILLLVPSSAIDSYLDPGEPQPDDRETVILKSGASQGRPWRRKPRLQMRLPFSVSAQRIRRSLAMALDLASGQRDLVLECPEDVQRRHTRAAEQTLLMERQIQAAGQEAEALRGDNQRLRDVAMVMMVQELPDGIQSRADALYVMGFPPGHMPDARTIKTRFRQLATIHHPDSDLGDHRRMSQLNAALSWLRTGRT